MALEGHRSSPNAASNPSRPLNAHHYKDVTDNHLLMSMDEDQRDRGGVLSRTLIQSPTVHTILPGKIRHKDLNDVCFVGDRVIQLLELQRTGYLEEIGTKTDFESSILAAKVIGSSDQEADDFVDVVVKQEHDSPMDQDKDIVGLPPQLLVVVLESKELLFLYATNNKYGSVDFHVSRRSLPVEVSSLDRYGELLAIDTKSRAMAVGSSQGHFGIMSLKPMEQIQHERLGVEQASTIMPITEERFFRVDGNILQMDFLMPPADQPRLAIVILLVSKNARTHILLYEWDTTLGLQHSSTLIGCSGQRLDPADSVPLMMIPSTLATAFMLVCEHGLATYSNVLGKTSYRKSVNLPHEAISNFKGSSSVPLWAWWARPQRHILRRGTHDDFYLCREDGLLHFVEIQKGFGEDDSIRVSLHFSTGSLRCNVDKAFAVMGGREDDVADVLLAAGDMSDGGVYHCMPRVSPTCNQIIANWAPLVDFLVIPDRNSTSDFHGDRIFACSGRGDGYGAVTELRTGLEAKIGLILEREDAITMTGIWVLPDLYNNRLILLTGHPMHSSLTVVDIASFDIEVVDEQSLPGFELGSPTLVAAIVHDSLSFQVTTSEIIACSLRADADADAAFRCATEEEDIRFATIVSLGSPTVVSITKDKSRAQSCNLHMRQFHEEHKGKISTIADLSTVLPMEATSLCVFPLMTDLLICVGSAAGAVSIFHGGSGLMLLNGFSLLPDTTKSDSCPVDSLAVIRSPDGLGNSVVLVGGFRNGFLVTLQLDITSPSLVPRRRRYHKLGHTSIRITEDPSDATSVFINDGKNIMRMTLLQGDEDGHYSLDNVWFTDRNNPSLGNRSVHALARLPVLPQWSMQGLERALICSVNDGMLFASCGARSQTVPRRIRLSGNPFRLALLDHLQKLAVGVEITTFSKSRIRCTRPGLEIVDIDANDDEQEMVQLKSSAFLLGKVGERMTCITHWTPKAQDKQYGMIVIGTRVEHSDPSTCDGRLIFATADKVNNDLKVKLKRTYRFINKPIYSLASYGEASLIVGLGQSLLLQSLDFETRKWQRRAEYHLPSSALQIVVCEFDIYITTAQHSILHFKVNNNQFVPSTNDKQARNGVSHTVLKDGPVVSSSGLSGGTITGLSVGSEKTFGTLFEVQMPQNITRLRKASKPGSGPVSGEVFYASTIDGLLYEFITLSKPEWQLLHFVQALHRQTKGPFFKRFAASKPLLRSRPIRPQPTDMHIDGESLGGLLACGSVYFREIMSYETLIPSSPAYGFLTPGERLDYFERMIEPLALESADSVESFMSWARRLLGIEA